MSTFLHRGNRLVECPPMSDLGHQRRSALITVADKCLLYSKSDRIAAWPRKDAKCHSGKWGGPRAHPPISSRMSIVRSSNLLASKALASLDRAQLRRFKCGGDVIPGRFITDSATSLENGLPNSCRLARC